MTEDFLGFGLPAKLLQALERAQFTKPTPVQQESIPVAMAGTDVLATAQTGTGKTLAFGIPLICKLMEQPTAQALVMAPTRELAAQVIAALQQMIFVPNIKTALLIGGEAMPRQLRQLDHHPRLIVGTPGRITDHLMRGSLKLTNAHFLVLDETDRMLDMGFGPQIDKIMEYMPAQRQTMMFSATLPENIVRMSRKYLKEPKRITVGSVNTAHVKIKQELIKMGEGEKYQHLLDQLGQRTGSVIIFVKTKYGTEKLSDRLNKDGHKSDAIHGDLQQRRRDRVIQGFRDQRYRILVATDVAARGLDIPHIEHVINYDLPQAPEDYIHRIGRTARAGAEGCAVNFLTPSDHAKWNAIHRLMNPGAPSTGLSEKREGGRGGFDRSRRGASGRKPWGAGGRSSAGGNGERRSFGGGHAAAKTDGDHRTHRAAGERPSHASAEPRAHAAAAGEHPRSHHASTERPRHADGERPRSRHAKTERPAHAGEDRPRSHHASSERPRSAEGEHPRSHHAKTERPAHAEGDRPRSHHAKSDRPGHTGGERRGPSGGERRSRTGGGGYKGSKPATAR
jgi:superfamily II DNA/RNA helicase